MFQICENGLISFSNSFCQNSYQSPSPPLIAGFWGDINIDGPKNFLSIFSIEISNESYMHQFDKSKKQILHYLHDGINCPSIINFEPTHIFVATWRAVKGTHTDNDVSCI